MSVRVAVVGGGIYGTNLLNSFSEFEREGLTKLVALADINEQVLNSQAKKYNISGYTDFREMLDKEEVDAVAVATPDHLHREITLEVINRGKHVLMQKPMDMTVEGCEEIVEEADKNNVLVEVDFHKRFDPPHRNLKKAIQAGVLGQIQYGYAWIEDTIEVPHEWLHSWAHKSSPSWFVGIHYYDLFIWMMGAKARKVYATGSKSKLLGMGINTYDSIQAKVEFDNGANIVFDSSWILPKHFPSINNQGCKVVGTEGIWEIDAQDRGVWTCDLNGLKTQNYYFLREDVDPLGRKVHYGYGSEAHREFVVHVNAIINKMPFNYEDTTLGLSAVEGIESTRIAYAVDESIKKGEIIKLR